MERDEITFSSLKKMGWRVMIIWQCELKPKTKDRTLQKLITALQHEQR